jgi:hypothetical protein
MDKIRLSPSKPGSIIGSASATGSRPSSFPSPLCGDNGLIHGWEDTPWDRQHDTRAVTTIPSPTTAH